ncbi:hypothetical protein P167DRAFT_539808 [Morchella conica CCBAS932]|uniref:Uncharacterized protein n=1 Tax=Morchella conica CCBAS932 TaxID=1392247 RepID=A0A3N4KEQ6_9PEZI|nr:hypothetical protein P167DRAFT_539808 [Morchella conica CCBAS932]
MLKSIWRGPYRSSSSLETYLHPGTPLLYNPNPTTTPTPTPLQPPDTHLSAPKHPETKNQTTQQQQSALN